MINSDELFEGPQDIDSAISFSGSDQSLSRAKSWVDICISSHEACYPKSKDVRLPTRLIDVGDGRKLPGQTARLVLGSTLPNTSQYVSLSHCWGEASLLRLSTSNIDSWKKQILEQDLPLTFQHAFRITRALGQRYLWIDSMCIIQDSLDQEDWIAESALMHAVYQNSVCNIAATSASCAAEGCFFQRSPSLIRQIFVLIDSDSCSLRRGAYVLSDQGAWEREVATAPLNTRAWVFQERMMSPRILHFTRTQIYFECRSGICMESNGNFRRKQSGLFASIPTCLDVLPLHAVNSTDATNHRRELFKIWYKIVQQYSQCYLTKNSDKLIALSAVAMEMQILMGDEYKAGLWNSDFHRGLLWNTGYHKRDQDLDSPEIVLRSRSSSWAQAPSWSWASVQGQIYNENFDDEMAISPQATILDVHVSTVNNSPFGVVTGGLLQIRGSLITADRNPMLGMRLDLLKSVSKQVPIKLSVSGQVIGIDAYIDTVDSDKSFNEDHFWLLPLFSVVQTGSRDTRGLILKRSSTARADYCQRIGVFQGLNESPETLERVSRQSLITIV